MSCRKLSVRSHLAVGALVILMAARASHPVGAQDLERLGVTGSANEYAEDIGIGVQSLDKFWTQEFATMNTPYQTPSGLHWYDINDQLYHGPCYPTEATAFYCRLDDAIYWDEPNLMRPWHAEIGDFAPLFVIAHEWGHAVQNRMGLLADAGVLNIDKELQADCFAGAWARYAEDVEDIIEDGDIEEALEGLLLVGDAAGIPWLDPSAHGTGSQRVRAFHLGYDEGRPRCFGKMPAPPKRRMQ